MHLNDVHVANTLPPLHGAYISQNALRAAHPLIVFGSGSVLPFPLCLYAMRT